MNFKTIEEIELYDEVSTSNVIQKDGVYIEYLMSGSVIKKSTKENLLVSFEKQVINVIEQVSPNSFVITKIEEKEIEMEIRIPFKHLFSVDSYKHTNFFTDKPKENLKLYFRNLEDLKEIEEDDDIEVQGESLKDFSGK